MKKLVSIIVPVYKVEQYLFRCVDSLIHQTYNNLEILLVDDGSPDSCPEICDEYALKDTRIKVIHKPNGGLSSARNAGLDMMTGDYCFFVDSDDFIHANSIEYLVGLAEKHNADLVQCSNDGGIGNDFSLNPFDCKEEIYMFDNRTIFESTLNDIIVWNKLYKSPLWQNVRMPIGRLNEDDATTWKLYYKAKKIVVSNLPLYYYRVNNGSIMAQLKKVPNIEHPMLAYHERVSFFDEIGDRHLSDLSKWRYSKYLMLSFGNPMLSTEQYDTLLLEFKKIYKDILKCKPVPILHKILIVMCRIAPKHSSIIVNRLRK